MLNRSAYHTAHGLIYRRLSKQELQPEGGGKWQVEVAAAWRSFVAKIYGLAERQLNKLPLIGL